MPSGTGSRGPRPGAVTRQRPPAGPALTEDEAIQLIWSPGGEAMLLKTQQC